MPAFLQLIPGKNKGSRPIDITGIDKFHLNADCIQAKSTVSENQIGTVLH